MRLRQTLVALHDEAKKREYMERRCRKCCESEYGMLEIRKGCGWGRRGGPGKRTRVFCPMGSSLQYQRVGVDMLPAPEKNTKICNRCSKRFIVFEDYKLGTLEA